MSIFLISGKVFAQTEIKDVVNIYTKVLSFDGLNAVNVTSSVGFGQGDTVMIAQMRGAIFSTDDPSVIDNPANTGKYELTVIGATPVGNKITFNSPLKNTYDNAEAVQLIRVPSYNHAKVVNKLTCSAWDGEKGGVLVLVANRSLTLNADIDVSGKGFSGKPAITFATGKCFSTSGVPYNTYNILNPSADSTSGLKGDGISTTKFVYTRGKGSAGNGGGAGSGSFTGGGGGGNYGLGGDGAIESCAGTGNSWGGMGGGIDPQYFSNVLSQRRIYLGGGGGSGIEKSSSSGSSGGDGGGVVILLTPYLITNNYFIRADGMDVTKLVTDGSSSGGGGGGGMVLLAVDSVKNKILSVSATGGNGGGTSGLLCEGHGGGGGGGFVWFSGKTMSFTSLDVSGGLAGQGNCDVSATAGYKGDSLNRLMLPLTGFLNNTIQAVPKTCYNTNVIIKASKPMGGNGVYTYLWEYRPYRTSTWLPAPGKNDTLGYKTSLLTDTVEFRRTVSSDGMNDVSRLLRIDVFPEIKLNSIDPDTTLCNGSPALKLRGKVATGGIGGITYEWGQRTISGTWEAAPGAAAGLDYTVPTDVTRYYRRKATSDYCSTYDSVKVEILPVIANNLVTPRQTICSGSVPVPYMGATPTGGDNVYRFRWQQSTDSLNWANTAVTNEDFTNPVSLTQTTYYRRIVASGLRDCCLDTSKNIKVIVLPLIGNNSITAPQTICEGTAPSLFTGSNPTGGDTNTGYRYKWESSKNNIKWDSIQYSPTIKDFQAAIQDTTRLFRRIVYSGLNDCCKSVSGEIKVTVQPKIKNNAIAGDTSICDNAIPSPIKWLHSSFSGGDGVNYSAKWMKKTNTGNWQDIPGAVLYNYQPPALTDSLSYQRVITSGTCIDYSNIVKVNVLNTIQGNQITGEAVVCEDFTAGTLAGGALTGGEPNIYRYFWEKSTNDANWEILAGESQAQLAPGILPQDLYFRRKVKSGPNDCCLSISNSFKISVDKKPLVPEAGPDKDLIFQDTTTLVAVNPAIGSGVWTTSSSANIYYPNKFSTKVSDLKFGTYVFYWTVTNGVCPSVIDSVVVNISDLRRYTGFSPNNDGVNDYFVVDGITIAPNKKLTIFNRWGVEVYQSSNYQNDWDGKGKNGNDLPEDTYFYVLKVSDVFNKGGERDYEGYVVIKR